MRAIEAIKARGHENILATNDKTFEITKDTQITRRGDCIVAVAADKSVKDLNKEFQKTLRKDRATLTMFIRTANEREIVRAFGNSRLAFRHQTDMVVRKSSYTCDRTLAVNADKAAKTFSRQLVEKLKDPQQRVYITLIAENSL